MTRKMMIEMSMMVQSNFAFKSASVTHRILAMKPATAIPNKRPMLNLPFVCTNNLAKFERHLARTLAANL